MSSPKKLLLPVTFERGVPSLSLSLSHTHTHTRTDTKELRPLEYEAPSSWALIPAWLKLIYSLQNYTLGFCYINIATFSVRLSLRLQRCNPRLSILLLPVEPARCKRVKPEINILSHQESRTLPGAVKAKETETVNIFHTCV